MAKSDNKMVLPALRGHMGDWVYYSALMSMGELAQRVRYAHELRPRKDHEMSKFIQRALENTSRVKKISSYLNTEERFFNSLVLAMYGGDPTWLDIALKKKSEEAAAVAKYMQGWRSDSLGFLELTGKEKIFALDGQHRLAGIKDAIEKNDSLGDELVSVLFVGHKNTKQGNMRTRRLFTTLNKTAVKVNRRDIIALDEDDVMAIITRKLVETHDWFKPPRISLASSSNIPKTDFTALTTVTSLYDTLKLLFSKCMGFRNDDLRFNRPSDEQLEKFEEYALDYFEFLRNSFSDFKDYVSWSSEQVIDSALRNDTGGHVIFRPIGLEIMTESYCSLKRSGDWDRSQIVSKFSKLPTSLSAEPYSGLIWNPRKQAINVKGKAVCKRVIHYMLTGAGDEKELLADYRKALEGVENADQRELPVVIQ